jgi:inhibitor of KinA sporulation pathway (predicted exonuclease)
LFYVKIIKNIGFGVGKTNYIIFDLEFNSTKNTKTSRFINEIIEIGAVKLDETLQEVDCFSCTVKPHFSKKLNPYVKKLTNITE